MEVALKVDVDTHQGLREGVPRLAEMLKIKGITATFFVAMGPDNSGRAIWRLVKNRGFVSKMWRTKAVSMYGWRTILSGTLLPSRPIASAFPEILRELVAEGFELGVHGYDHVRWQDNLDNLGEPGIRHEIDQGLEVYRTLLGTPARSFAAPGWRTNRIALEILDAKGLAYRSDTRGDEPYRCLIDGQILVTPEIPTTLPTMDEVMGTHGIRTSADIVRFYLPRFAENRLNVHTIHAETEGGTHLETLRALIDQLTQRGAHFLRLEEVARNLSLTTLPLYSVTRMTLPGRAGWVSAQGSKFSPG
jgi:undecaprenyl phosphate-alpha-L-ara4FN deformylase